MNYLENDDEPLFRLENLTFISGINQFTEGCNVDIILFQEILLINDLLIELSKIKNVTCFDVLKTKILKKRSTRFSIGLSILSYIIGLRQLMSVHSLLSIEFINEKEELCSILFSYKDKTAVKKFLEKVK